MPPEAVSTWAEDFAFDVRADEPRTAVGLLTSYLLWHMQQAESGGHGRCQRDPLVPISNYFAKRQLTGSALDRRIANADETNTRPDGARVVDALTNEWLSEIDITG